MVEVGFRPGVTDNEGKTGREAIEDRLGRKLKPEESVHTSTQYLINGKLTQPQVEKISKELLGNELIERFSIIERQQVERQHRALRAARQGYAQAPRQA